MVRITANNVNSLLIKFIIKIVLSTAVSVTVLSSLASFILLKLDLDLSAAKYIGVAVTILSAFIISNISISGFKNNLLVMSLFSVLPLAVFSIINFCVNKTEPVYVIIKVIAIFAIALISSVIMSKKALRR